MKSNQFRLVSRTLLLPKGDHISAKTSIFAWDYFIFVLFISEELWTQNKKVKHTPGPSPPAPSTASKTSLSKPYSNAGTKPYPPPNSIKPTPSQKGPSASHSYSIQKNRKRPHKNN